MSFLGESQQHTLREIGELLLEIRQLIDAQSISITKFGQQSLTEEAPNSLDARSPQQSTWHTRPPDVQPTTRQVSAGRWRPPPSLTIADIKSLEALEAQPYMRTEAPLFNGDDPLGWIFGIQAYFNYFYTDESVRLAVVEKLIEQPASDWFHHYQQNNVDDSWMDFLLAVRHHFAPELTEDEVSQAVDENHLGTQPSNMESNNIIANGIGFEPIICDESFGTNSKDADNAGDIVVNIALDSRQPMEEINGVDSFFCIDSPKSYSEWSVEADLQLPNCKMGDSELQVEARHIRGVSGEAMENSVARIISPCDELPSEYVIYDGIHRFVESILQDPPFESAPTKSYCDFVKSCPKQPNLISIDDRDDRHLFRLEQALTADGRSIPPRDDAMLLGRNPITGWRAMPPRTANSSSFDEFRNRVAAPGDDDSSSSFKPLLRIRVAAPPFSGIDPVETMVLNSIDSNAMRTPHVDIEIPYFTDGNDPYVASSKIIYTGAEFVSKSSIALEMNKACSDIEQLRKQIDTALIPLPFQMNLEAESLIRQFADWRTVIGVLGRCSFESKNNCAKSRKLDAQLIPWSFGYFPGLSVIAVHGHLDLCEVEEIGIRVQAIQRLPFFCEDTHGHISQIADILAQLPAAAERNVEHDVRASLTALFKHIESVEEKLIDENQREMERQVPDLIKESLQDVPEAEFNMFMDFLKSLGLLRENAHPERIRELIEFIESQADMDAQLDDSDGEREFAGRNSRMINRKRKSLERLEGNREKKQCYVVIRHASIDVCKEKKDDGLYSLFDTVDIRAERCINGSLYAKCRLRALDQLKSWRPMNEVHRCVCREYLAHDVLDTFLQLAMGFVGKDLQLEGLRSWLLVFSYLHGGFEDLFAQQSITSGWNSSVIVPTTLDLLTAEYTCELLTTLLLKTDNNILILNEYADILEKIEEHCPWEHISALDLRLIEAGHFASVDQDLDADHGKNFLSIVGYDRLLLLLLISTRSTRSMEFSDSWKQPFNLLTQIANTRVVDIGDVKLVAYLFDTTCSGPHSFRYGLLANWGFSLGYASSIYLYKHIGVLSIEAITNWLVTNILSLPQTPSPSMVSLVTNFIVQSQLHQVTPISKVIECATSSGLQTTSTYSSYSTLWTRRFSRIGELIGPSTFSPTSPHCYPAITKLDDRDSDPPSTEMNEKAATASSAAALPGPAAPVQQTQPNELQQPAHTRPKRATTKPSRWKDYITK